ncbi:MAG: CoA-binding protein [Cyclobacteriaceae bacterium]
MKARIDQFLACKKFAIAGVSRNKHKFGNTIFKELKNKNFDIVPISPNMDSFEGEKCYYSVGDLPSDVEALIIVTKPEASLTLLKEAANKGIRNIFLQQGAQNKEIIEYAESTGINLICQQCILMFANPSGIHKFHERISKFFGFYPN